MNNPQRILETLDSFLEKETRVVLFGRAALALGYGENGAQFGKTQDVDAILPTVEMTRIDSDTQFWAAIDLTNRKLHAQGLYISHLFEDKQVILTPDWLEKIVPIPSSTFRYLRLYRPSSIDLILTKMMRNDKEDVTDIQFIVNQDRVSAAQLELAFSKANQTDVRELRDIFVRMQATVLQISSYSARNWEQGIKPESFARSVDPDWWSKLTDRPDIDRSRGIEKDLEP